MDLQGAASTNDLTSDFTYNPASQIASTTRSNDSYAWTGHGSGTTSAQQVNGLSQLSNWENTLGHDSKGNTVSNGTYTYGYSSENLLTSLTNPAGTQQTSSTYSYDPLMRLAAIDSNNPLLDTQLGYDGQEIVLEALSDNRTRRYVRGPGVDEALVAYLVTAAGTSRSWYLADERGSTLRQTGDGGAPQGGIGRYDEYGVGPGTSRFQYTGQYWLGDGNLHYYRARVYDPRLGRFLQPDPIGYGDGLNMYAYVGADPVNASDTTGLCTFEGTAHFVSKWDSSAGAYGPWEHTGNTWEKSGSCDINRFRSFQPNMPSEDGGGGGGELAAGNPFTEQTPEEQRKNCHTNDDIARGLATPGVRARAAEAFAADARTNWEWGFWTAPKGNSVHAFGLGTSREFGWMDPNDAYPWMISRLWHGTGAPNVMYHTHNSGLGLSVDDVNWAKDSGNSIVAIGGKDVNYCYPG